MSTKATAPDLRDETEGQSVEGKSTRPSVARLAVKLDPTRVDIEEARAFLAKLDPDPNARFGFQPYEDDKEKPRTRAHPKGYDPFARDHRHGRFDDLADELTRLNAQGAAIAPIVNELDGRGYSVENVVRVRAAFLDLDDVGNHRDAADAVERIAFQGPLRPSAMVQSSEHGIHAYWFLSESLPLEQFRGVQDAIARRFGAKPGEVSNLNRAMRAPGFVHAKYPAHRHRSTLIYLRDARYSAAEVLAAFPPETDDSVEAAPKREREPATFDAATLEDALKAIPPDSPEDYATVMRAVKLTAEEAGFPDKSAKELVRDWAKASSRWPGNRDRAFDSRWASFKRARGRQQRLGSVFKLAGDYGWRRPGKLDKEEFRCHMESGAYFFLPTRSHWTAGSVDARVPKIPSPGGPIEASTWIRRHRYVDQVTWFPGEPEVIEGRHILDGGWVSYPGATVLNLYRPPLPHDGDPAKADPWREHLATVYPDEAEHIERWFACRVQWPGVKINHGLFFGGEPGIGKDTILAPIKRAVGPWNFGEASPGEILGQWTGFAKSVVLRISEARDLGGSEANPKNRYALYEHLKAFTCTPPETLTVNEKNLKQYLVPNVTGAVTTSNHRDGLYLPGNDRRWHVSWSPLRKGALSDAYFRGLYGWFGDGGERHVAAYLAQLDLGEFNPKADAPKTEAFYEAVRRGTDPGALVVAGALEELGNPDAVTVSDAARDPEAAALLADPRNARRLLHLFGEAGYVLVPNPDAKSGRWRIGNVRGVIYARCELDHGQRIAAARARAAGDDVPF